MKLLITLCFAFLSFIGSTQNIDSLTIEQMLTYLDKELKNVQNDFPSFKITENYQEKNITLTNSNGRTINLAIKSNRINVISFHLGHDGNRFSHYQRSLIEHGFVVRKDLGRIVMMAKDTEQASLIFNGNKLSLTLSGSSK